MLVGKELKEYKVELYKIQNGICKLCKTNLDSDIQKNHLDHDHALEGINAGKVRGLLCHNCNVLEGIVRHKFNRSGLVRKGVHYESWLSSLMEYITSDNSDSRIHPGYLKDMVKKFSNLNKEEQQKILIEEFNITIDGTKQFLTKEYRKLLKSKLTKKEP